MRIAVLTDIPFLSGQTSYLDEIVRGLNKQGVEVNVFVVRYPNLFKLEGKVPLFRFVNSSTLLSKLATYDILHAQFSFPIGFFLTVLKKIHNRSVIIHTHGYDVFSVPSIGYGLRRNIVGKFLAQQAWTKASNVIAVCNRSKMEIHASGIPIEKVSVLYNGVNTELFRHKNVLDETLIKLREESDIIFLNIGSLTPVKNQENLLSAFGRFVKSHKAVRKPRLIICGQGPKRQTLLERARELRVLGLVIFMNQRPHNKMPEILSIADAFVLPSFSEGHPWSLLEAMSCEVPSVASAVGGIPETIQDNELLIRSPVNSVNPVSDIFEKMVLLASNQGLRKEVGAKNRKIVVEQFSFRDHLKQLMNIYGSIEH